jgi:ATP-dependent helicase/nuclease subunit A
LASATALQDSAAYFERLESIERNGDIEDIARLEEALRDLYASTDASVAASVELMTIHRAKGLEFDVVILPALDSTARHDDPPVLRAQELPQLAGERSLLLAPIAPRGSEKDSIYTWLELLDKERARFEKGRLLYVAATRAERELHLFGAVESNDGVLGKPRANTFLHLLWPSIETEFTVDPSAATPLSSLANTERAIHTHRLPLAWQLPPAAEPESKPLLRDVIENEPLHPEFEWVGETGRHIGTLVHREIERIARAGLDSITTSTIAANSARYSIELAELGVPPHLREGAVARVSDALMSMLNDERGRWLLAGDNVHSEATSELALSGVIGRDIVNGVIDRTFVDRDGTRWIVDFKTSAHEGGGLDAFLASEVARYTPQLQRYAKLMQGYRHAQPIKAALYFPLLKAWREVI